MKINSLSAQSGMIKPGEGKQEPARISKLLPRSAQQTSLCHRKASATDITISSNKSPSLIAENKIKKM